MKKILLSIFAFLFFTSVVNAQAIGDYGTAAAGPASWTTASTWVVCVTNGTWTGATVAGSVPTTANNVWIRTGHTVTIGGTAGNCKDLNMVGGILTLSGGTTRTVNMAGLFSMTSGTVNINSTSGNTYFITGSTGIAISGGTIDFSGNGAGACYISSSGNIDITASPTFNFTSNTAAAERGFRYTGTSTSSTIASTVAIGSINITGSGTLTTASNITVNNTGGKPFTFTSGNFKVGSGFTFTLPSTATLTLGASKTVTVDGTFINQSTTGLNGNTSTAFSVSNGGTYVHNTSAAFSTPLNGFTLNTGSNFIYRGSSSLTPSMALSARTFYNLTFESTSGAWTSFGGVTGAGTLTIQNNLSVGGTGGGTVSMGLTGFSGTIDVAKDLTIVSGNTLNLTTGNSNISVGGNWSNSGTFTPGTNTVTFNGTGSQSITKSSGETFNNLTVNKSAGTLSLANNVTVSGTLAFTSGNLELGANNLTLASANAVTTPAATKCIVTNGAGVVKCTYASGSYTFPVGTSTKYTPVTITNTGGVSQTYSVGVASPTTFSPSADAANYDWYVATGGGTSASTLAFSWLTADAGANLSATPSGGYTYQNSVLSSSSSTATGTPNVTTVTGITSFTDTKWNVATSNSPNFTITNPLSSFGNTILTQTAGPNMFTITGANLTTADVTVAALSGFTYSTTAGGTYLTSLSLPQGGGSFSQDIYVKFDPTAIQSYNGNIVVGGGGASDKNVAAVGSGVASTTSTVSATGGYSYTSNIPYSTYTAASSLATGNSVGVMGLTINDLSGDGLSTQLTAITFTVPANTGNAIKAAALFDGATNVSELTSVSGTSITFSGLSLTAANAATKDFELRVTFENAVVEHQMTFTVSSVTANAAGSLFAASNGGAAASSTATGATNKIEVTATQLVYTTAPASTANVNTNLTTIPIVKATDAGGNVDIDFSYTGVSITNSASIGMSNVPTASNGVAGVFTFTTNFQFTATGNTTLSVAAGGFTATSSSIAITLAPVVIYQHDFTASTTTPYTATPTIFDANLSSSSWSNNSGAGTFITANGTGNTGNSLAVSTIANTPYTLTFNIASGYELKVTAFNFWRFSSQSGNTISSITINGITITSGSISIPTGGNALSGTSIGQTAVANTVANITGQVIVNINLVNGGNTGSFRLDDFALLGNVTAITSPYLTTSVTSLAAFASTAVGATSTSQTFNLFGGNLTGAPSNIVVAAPSTDFQVSADNTSFGPTANIAYASATLSSTPVYVRFSPQSVGAKSGNITFSGAGVSAPYLPTVSVSGTASSATYYSKSTGTLENTANWGTNTDGTGIAPLDFTSANQTFNVANNATPTIGAAWAVAGTASKIIVTTGSNFTIPSGFALTTTSPAVVDVQTNATLTIANTTIPTFGTLSAGSTINYAGAGQTITVASYKNLDLTGASSITFPAGTVGVAETFTPSSITSAAAGTISFNGTAVQTIPSFGFNILNINNTTGTALSVTTGSETATCIINAGLTVTVGGAASSLTRTNGNLLVMGTINNSSTTAGVFSTTNAQLGFGSTGAYNYNGGGAATNAYLPAATWNSTSTATITGVGAMTSNGITAPTPGTAGGASAKYGNITIDNPNLSGAANAFKYFGSNWSSPVNIGGNLTLGRTGTAGTPLQTTTGSPTITIDGNLVVYAGNYGLITYAATSTWNVGGSVIVDATYSFGSATGYTDPTLTIAGNAATAGNLNVKGDITIISGANAGTGSTQTASIARTIGTATLTLNGTGTQTITGMSGTGVSGNINTVINKASGTATLASNCDITGTLTLTNGALAVGTNTLTLNSTVTATSGTLTSATTGTVNYNQGTNGQAVLAANYGNLTFSNFNKTLASSGTIGIAGTFANGSGSHTVASSTIDFNGAAQNIPAFTFNNLTASGSSTKTAQGDIVIGGVLSVSSTIDMATNVLSGAFTTSGTGTLKTQHTATASPLPTGKTWSMDVEYNAPSSAQTVMIGTYNNLLLSGASTKIFSGTSCTVSKDFTVSGGTVTAPTTFVFNGATAQNIAGLNYTNVDMSGAGTKTFTSNASLTDAMTFASSTGTIDFDGASNDKIFTIKSTSTNTGRLGNTNGTTLNGNITMERYISSLTNRAYRLLAPSVNTAGSIKDNWQEGKNNAVVNVNVPSDVAGYGTHITGTTGNAGGFDVTQNNQASLFLYNPVTPAWDAVTSTSGTLSARTGYLLFVRGNRDNINTINTTTGSSNTTLRATGTIEQGTVTLNNLRGNAEFNLVTNPYPSPIRWDATANGMYGHSGNSANFENAITVWDPNIGTRGGYVTITDVGGVTYTAPGTSLLTRDIQSGQAFFVQAKSGTSTPCSFEILESHKTTINNLDIYRSGTQTELLKSILFFTDVNGIRRAADGITNAFSNNFSNNVDGNDAEQIDNWDEDIYINRGTKNLSIETRKLVDDADTIPITVARLKRINYQWEFQPENFNAPGLQAFLKDNFTNTSSAISLNSVTVIPFSVTTDAASAAANRFSIIFKAASALPVNITNVKAAQKNQGVQIDWATQNETNIDSYEVEKSANANNFNKLGTIKANNASTTNTYNMYDAAPFDGINYYRIKSIEKNGKTNYSQIVKVNISKGAANASIYPNPIVGNTINVQLSNMVKGNYTVAVINKIGQQIFTKQIIHNGGSATQAITLDNVLANGTYQLKITGTDATFVQQFIKQ